MKGFDASGIRKVFELGAKLPDPINLSIGQPDFDVPEQARAAAIEAIQGRKNGYALTQGVPLLQERLQAQVDRGYGHGDRHVFVTSGTSGGLMLALLALVDPGDEVIVFDPYFVMYNALVEVAGGKAVYVDTYPDFRLDPDRVAAAVTPRTKLILFNSPANPTGYAAGEEEVRCSGRAGGTARDRAGERRDLSSLLLRRPFRLAGPIQRPHDRGRRIQQDLRHARLAVGVRPRAAGDHPGDDQAPAVQFRLRPQPFQWAGAAAWTSTWARNWPPTAANGT